MRSNCIAPAARTRLTEATPGLGEVVAAPDEGFDLWDPANVSPLVAYLATADCAITGRTFFVQGGTVRVMEPWRMGDAPRARRPMDDRRARQGAADRPRLSPIATLRGNGPSFCVRSREQSSCPARWGGVLDVAFPSRRDEAAAPAGRARPRRGTRPARHYPAAVPKDLDDSRSAEELSIDAPGADEVARRPVAAAAPRARGRADGRQPALPVDRPRRRPVRALLGRLHHHDPLGLDPADRRRARQRHQHRHVGRHRPAARLRGGRPGDGQARRPLRPSARLRAVDGVRVRVRRAHRGWRGAPAR